jgi:hypothetical protein
VLTLDAQWIQRASEACRRALDIDVQLLSAYVALGRIRAKARDKKRADPPARTFPNGDTISGVEERC